MASWNPKEWGFDAVASVRLPPRSIVMANRMSWRSPLQKLRYRVADWRRLPTIHQYEHVIDHFVVEPTPGIESIPCVIPNWDNTPRSGTNGMVVTGSTPELFRKHLRKALRQTADVPKERRIVLIKSWNEWAEGNYLEPDLRHGHGYLEAIRDELART